MNDDSLSIPKNIDLTVIEMEEYWSSEGQKINKPNGCNHLQSHMKFLHCRIYVKILQVTFQLLVGIFQIKKCLWDIIILVKLTTTSQHTRKGSSSAIVLRNIINSHLNYLCNSLFKLSGLSIFIFVDLLP